MTNLRIECKFCLGLWQIIGTKGKLKGRLLINPLGAICFGCAGKTMPPLIANLWEWNAKVKKWAKFGGKYV